jgi:hypothetical protein
MDLTKLRKVESPGPRRAAEGVTGTITAIVKVKRAGYRPAQVKVRSSVDEKIFTAEFPAEALEKLEKDPEVEAVSISRPLQEQKR